MSTSGLPESAVVVILGRPNVGKSSLFNRLTGGRRALVSEEAGLTRDLRFGSLAASRREEPSDASPPVLVDTAGLKADPDRIQQSAAQLAWQQAARSDLVMLVTDATLGPTGFDEEILDRLRRSGRTLLLVANKTDRARGGRIQSDHAPLGLGEALEVSARTGRGMALLRRRIREMTATGQPAVSPSSGQQTEDGKVIVLTGRPNAGKSTLLNRFCGEMRSLVDDEAGTTRDEVEAGFTQGGKYYRLLDTAGVQRRWQTAPPGQALAAARSLASLQRAAVAVHLVDATQGLRVQDRRLIGRALEEAVGVVLAINKVDVLDAERKKQYERSPGRGLDFAPFVPHCLISAQTGQGVDRLLRLIEQQVTGLDNTAGTAQINRILQRLLQEHPPPMQRGRRPRLRYAHPVAGKPRYIRIYGTACERVPEHYRRYLEKGFEREFGQTGLPVRIGLRSVVNPYVSGNRNR